MSAPNLDKPNEGIIGQVSNSIQNAANYVSETIQGNASEASKEANKEAQHRANLHLAVTNGSRRELERDVLGGERGRGFARTLDNVRRLGGSAGLGQ